MTKLVAGVGFLIYGVTIFACAIADKVPGWVAPGGAIIVLYGIHVLDEMGPEDL